MSTKYFKDKAKDLLSRIIDEYESNKDEEDMEVLIYLCLKEVARDQRYACVETFRSENLSKYCSDTYMEGIIQNATRKEK